MKYRVVWSPDAFDRLLREWNAAGKPESAITAFDRVEGCLSDDGDVQGEPRDENRRILLSPPVGVLFEVQPRPIVVIDAWMIRSTKS